MRQLINSFINKINYKTTIPFLICWTLFVLYLPASVFVNMLHYLYLGIVLLIVIVIGYVLFLRTEWGVYLFAFLIPFQLYVIPGSNLSVTNLLVKVIFTISVLKILLKKSIIYNTFITNFIVLFIFIIGISSIVYSYDDYMFVLLNDFSEYLTAFSIFYVILINIDNKHKLKILLHVLMLSGFVSTCMSIYFMTRDSGYTAYFSNTYAANLLHGYRLSVIKESPGLLKTALHGTFASNNYYAAFMSISFCLSYCFMLFNKGKPKIFYFCLFLFFLFAIILSNSRGALLGIIASFFVMNFFNSRKNISGYFYILIIFLIVFLCFYFFDFSYILKKWRLDSLEHSKDVRFFKYIMPAWDMFLKSPIIGIGSKLLTWSHNLFVDVLVKSGIVGLIVWLIIFYKIFRLNIKKFISSIKNFEAESLDKILPLSIIGIHVYLIVHGSVSLFMNHRKHLMLMWICFALSMISFKNVKGHNINFNINKIVLCIGVLIVSFISYLLIFNLSFFEIYFVFTLIALLYLFILGNLNTDFYVGNKVE